MRALLDGAFFAEWSGTLDALAEFSGISRERLSWHNTDAAELDRQLFKVERDKCVAKITVTTSSGRVFDGDEMSTTRMMKAVKVLEYEPQGTTTLWVLADNIPAQVGLDEFLEAMKLAGLEQTRLWLPDN